MKGYKHLTAEQKQAIEATYQQTLSVGLTAQALAIDVQRVRHYLKVRGIPLSNGRSVCYQHAQEVRQWAAEGVSLSEIARRIGTKHQTVAAFLERHQIEHKRVGQALENNAHWKGGRRVDSDGYVLLRMPGHHLADTHNYVREHRLVMEQTLGRRLLRSEVVHHKDGDKQNNHPDNLELYHSNAAHLAETLKGQVPNWTEEGIRRMKAPRPYQRKDQSKTPNRAA